MLDGPAGGGGGPAPPPPPPPIPPPPPPDGGPDEGSDQVGHYGPTEYKGSIISTDPPPKQRSIGTELRKEVINVVETDPPREFPPPVAPEEPVEPPPFVTRLPEEPIPAYNRAKPSQPKLCCIGFNPEDSKLEAIIQVPPVLHGINSNPCDQGATLRVGFWLKTGVTIFLGATTLRVYSYFRTIPVHYAYYSVQLELHKFLNLIRECGNDPGASIICVSKISPDPIIDDDLDIRNIPAIEFPSKLEAPIQYPKISIFGIWEHINNATKVFPAYAVTLINGKILMFSSTENKNACCIYDPKNGTVQEITPPPVKRIGGGKKSVTQRDEYLLDGVGVATLPDGKIFFAGGLEIIDPMGTYDASGQRFIYDPYTNTWTNLGKNFTKRYKPSLVTLMDGRIFFIGGVISVLSNTPNVDIETFDPNTRGNSITKNQNIISSGEWDPDEKSIYERAHLFRDRSKMQSENIFVSTQGTIPGKSERRGVFLYKSFGNDPWKWHDLVTRFSTERSVDSHGISVLLPLEPPYFQPKIMVLSEPELFASILEPNANPPHKWKEVNRKLSKRRTNGYAVLLPDKTVLFCGGTNLRRRPYYDSSGTKEVEIYDPATGNWSLGSTMPSIRSYNSIASLLYDGRVLMAGSLKNGLPGSLNQDLSFDIYTPDYLWRGPRPTFTIGKDIWRTGELLNIYLGADWSHSQIKFIGLMRCCYVTHSHIFDQRYVQLEIEEIYKSNRLKCKIPDEKSVVPPGYYWIFVVSETGCPSLGQIISIRS